MLLLPIRGIRPRVGSGSTIAGVVIGRAVLGRRVRIATGAVIRADVNDVRIGDDVEIGTNSVLHVAKYNPAGRSLKTTVGDRCRIGAGAVLHACHLKDDVVVGPGAIVLDGAVIESRAVIMPGALIAPFKRVGAGQVWAGLPARAVGDRGVLPLYHWADLGRFSSLDPSSSEHDAKQ